MSRSLSAWPASKHDIHVKRKIHAVIECHWITISEIMAPYFPTVSFEKWVLANTGAKWWPRSCLLGLLLLSKLRFEERSRWLFISSVASCIFSHPTKTFDKPRHWIFTKALSFPLLFCLLAKNSVLTISNGSICIETSYRNEL